jgi:trk system potassium uptake protein TrkA
MSQLHLLKEQLGLSMAINPELACARAIARVIKFPPATRVDTFAKGRVELVEFRLPEDSAIVGKRLMDLPRRTDSRVLVCAVERDEDTFIPDGSFMLKAGDRLHLTGAAHAVTKFLGSIGGVSIKVRSMMIVGGGRLGYYLADMLAERHFHVRIIEKDMDRCTELCELLPHAEIIHGDGSDLELLESQGLCDVNAFVALTGMDEENMIMSMVAKQRKVPKVVTKVNQLHYLSMVEKMGVDTVVSPKMTTANEITQYVRAMQNTVGSKVNTLYKLVGGKAEALEFTAGAATWHRGETLEQVQLKPGLLVAAIVRQGRVIIPNGKDVIMSGDSVVIISTYQQLHDLNDIFEE